MHVSTWTIAALMAALPAMAGATEDVPATIPRVVLPAPELSRYARALTDTDLNARLSGPGPITALVPRNAPRSAGPSWPTHPGEAAQAARALVVDGTWDPAAIRSALRGAGGPIEWKTDTGAYLLVTSTPDGRLLVIDEDGNTAHVVGPARPAGNGAVVVLSRPLASR